MRVTRKTSSPIKAEKEERGGREELRVVNGVRREEAGRERAEVSDRQAKLARSREALQT